MRPGISVSAMRISLRPQLASDRSATAYAGVSADGDAGFRMAFISGSCWDPDAGSGRFVSLTHDQRAGERGCNAEVSSLGPEAALQRSSKPVRIVACMRDSRAMTASRPQPLSALPDARARAVRGVLTDIDDTLTERGALDPRAAQALEALHAAAIPVIAITGRPQGWCEPFARDWPVDAIVAENGAVALFREGGELVVE